MGSKADRTGPFTAHYKAASPPSPSIAWVHIQMSVTGNIRKTVLLSMKQHTVTQCIHARVLFLGWNEHA